MRNDAITLRLTIAVSRDDEWKVPLPEEEYLWRGERGTVTLLLFISAGISIVISIVAVAVAWKYYPSPWAAFPLTVAGALLSLRLLQLAFAYRRTELGISTLRAWVRGGTFIAGEKDLPLAGLTSVRVSWSSWYAPLQLADITIRTGGESLRLPAVENWVEAVYALREVQRRAGLGLESVHRSETGQMFVPVPLIPAAAELAPAPQALHDPIDTLETPAARPADLALLIPAVVVVLLTGAFIAIGAARGGRVDYPVNDAIYPAGTKKSSAEIADLMEREVMPFARVALGPIVGGAEKVTCYTCHGADAESRAWRMPAVRALPDPGILRTMTDARREGGAVVQTAIYGYSSTALNQAKMKRMREVVLPGMARILRRPAYDFTRSYDYNQHRFALGCYHCHELAPRVKTTANPGTMSTR